MARSSERSEAASGGLGAVAARWHLSLWDRGGCSAVSFSRWRHGHSGANLLRPLDVSDRCCNNATIQHVERVPCGRRAATSSPAARKVSVEKTNKKRSSRNL
jgi:hypothetical protein